MSRSKLRRRPFAACMGAVILLLIGFQSAATSYIWTPVATRVEKADLIVIGRVIADSLNKHDPRRFVDLVDTSVRQ